jgi:UDP-N-acetyl-2-amino-2-deoxyglucuronate dehydrogenase
MRFRGKTDDGGESVTAAPIGFAILGTGIIAETHRQAIAMNANLGARLVAVGHYDPSRFAAIGERFGVPCLSEAELLKRLDVDVVCVATPSGQHAEQAIAAAEAGKHVLVEKPLALGLADADAMIVACDTAGVRLGVLLQQRAEPLFRRVYQAIRAGDLGDIAMASVCMPYHRPQAYYDQSAWRGTWEQDGGGVLMNQGIHFVDLLLWLMGADPVHITARAATLQRQIEAEDTVVATLEFGTGALATLSATTTAPPGFRQRVEVYGTAGAIQLEGDAAVRWETAHGTGQDSGQPTNPAAPAAATPTPAFPTAGSQSPVPHAALIRDFVEALRDGRPPAVDGREGRRSVAAVLGIYEAAGLLPRRG